MSQKLILVDLDGTLIRKDSLKMFLWFIHPILDYLQRFAASLPVLIGWKLGKVDDGKAKESLLITFLKGKTQNEIEHSALIFSRDVLPKTLRKRFLDYLNQEKSSGARVLIVSASPDIYVSKFAEWLGFESIATKLDLTSKALGSFSSRNCKGEEKANRIKDYLNLGDYSIIEAYGDSTSDLPMIKLANQKGFTDSSFL